MDSFQYLYAGYSNVGTFTLAGGTVNICAQFIVGHEGLDIAPVIATGAVWVTGGQLTMDSGDSIVGNSGVGQMSISNGVVTAAKLTVGNSANASSFGTLTLAGGTLTTTSLVLPYTHSRFNFSGGNLNAYAIIGTNGQTWVVGNGVTPATLNLFGGVTSFSKGLTISTHAMLTGCGTVTGTVANSGTILADCAGPLTFTGIVTNNGVMQATHGSVLETFSNLVNNGTIDVFHGNTNFHGVFVNNGTVIGPNTVLISNQVQAAGAAVSGDDVLIEIDSTVVSHTYHLEFATSPRATNWTTIGASQDGTGGLLTFTDPHGATNAPVRFYRIGVTP